MEKIEFKSKRSVERKEGIIRVILTALGAISILITLGIIISLFKESASFFGEISLFKFLFGTKWTPMFEPARFGVVPLLVGTLLIVIFSSIISIPIGLLSAVYLSEYAKDSVRKVLKPTLEILAGIPSIVYGYFALTAITPFLRKIFPTIEVFNALSAGIAVGIMTIPMVSSLSEDAMAAVPKSMREGAYALGCTKQEVATKVVIPAASSSIIASFILSISRAIGETMVVAMAAGSTPQLTFNPLKSVQTMTGYIVQISMGDVPYGTLEYKTIFAVGTLLFIITFILNIISRKVVKSMKY